MIDRTKLEKIANVMDELEKFGIRSSCDVKSDSVWNLWAWCSRGMEEEKTRQIIAVLTPLVGKMTRNGESWYGIGDGIDVTAYQASACRILGHKKVIKTVKKEVERDPEYVEVEEEVLVPITDCDIKAGKFSKDDIEVPA